MIGFANVWSSQSMLLGQAGLSYSLLSFLVDHSMGTSKPLAATVRHPCQSGLTFRFHALNLI
ncbi:hypothetical protein Poly59_28670 [Rubripirellula reticaptiva]|uniref:Uncharacterized protein n=1 Tax=Rubripirellula reticaptiva TaxID=2528013 RepID=A0A5C6ERM1_9BACT|nr:hypothetical protein Poly59_28670 [Rubripirellula reticaptiva]